MAQLLCSKCKKPADYYAVTQMYSPTIEGNPKVLMCSNCISGAKYQSCGECNTYYIGQSVIESWIVQIRGHGVYCRLGGCLSRKFWQHDNHPWTRKGATCNTCGVNENGEVPRCRCGLGSEDNPIHNYSCEPRLYFHEVGKSTMQQDPPKGELFIGFELEIQIRDDVIKAAQFARAKLQSLEIAQLKSDGSIGGGFELVTQPHTYEKYREQKILWDTIDDIRSVHGGRSWDPGTCGFHIHVGRSGFKDKAHQHRFVEMIYRNAEMMMKFGGRRSGYAKFDDVWAFGEYDQPVFSLEKKGGDNLQGGDKYAAVNTGKPHTLEMRFMRGTTKIDSILAYLGMAHALVKYTEGIKDAGSRDYWYNWEDFNAWVESRQSIYPELYGRMPSIKALKISDLDQLQIRA